MAQVILKVVLPKNKLFDFKKFTTASVKVLNKTRDDIQKEFEKTTATWKGKPSFRGDRATTSKMRSQMWANSDKWVWVVRGTKPHIIRPRSAKMLSFKSGFTSKTIPRRIMSRRGGSSGMQVFAKVVNHPGTKARDFDIVVAKEQQPKLTKAMKRAIKQATP